ncbi:MAG: thioredoxin fold domain-containing protein [Polaromonas sp.]|uniref:thioredoxin family protein n=1 Tax=Polaromonas sp. TaxID=1869339 RepID=UPI00248A4124|nr:thioredoxin fold domain-containing protein [Polaromonas sp.]MDI1237323.1 thioredoxin fold domain-containing protein [Polaromonas sp.]
MNKSLLTSGATDSGRFPLARRRLLLAGAAVFACGASVAAPAVLPASASLPDELEQALKKGMPLVVMVSLDGCPFCKVARESYLVPLREQQGVVVVQLDMRSRQRVKDFKGAMLTHDELIRSWGIKVAPTVLFFGRGGAEIAERMVGGYIPDFYGAYLDERLRLAQVALRS